MVSSTPHLASKKNHAPSSNEQEWAGFLEAFIGSNILPTSHLQAVFGPLRRGQVDDMMVLGQLGQTMDGRIATATGQSKYINGKSGLTHLHQLRALVDAVVVGVGTALADNPQLNVRMVSGRHPARVVIDPKAKLQSDARVWDPDGARRLWIVAEGVDVPAPEGVEVIRLTLDGGRMLPQEILTNLRAQGMHRVLIEGGAETVSRFLQAGCLDRLHLIVAPILMGSGRASLNLPAIEHMDQAMRLDVRTHLLENEVLFDCDLSKQRVPIG